MLTSVQFRTVMFVVVPDAGFMRTPSRGGVPASAGTAAAVTLKPARVEPEAGKTAAQKPLPGARPDPLMNTGPPDPVPLPASSPRRATFAGTTTGNDSPS